MTLLKRRHGAASFGIRGFYFRLPNIWQDDKGQDDGGWGQAGAMGEAAWQALFLQNDEVAK
ncbi:MAG: hypothetical protein ACO1TE_19945 [Prosthecobacter sp.]